MTILLSAKDRFSPTLVETTVPASRNPGLGCSVGVKGAPALPGYKILAVLGRGGMAIVYKARQLCPRRLVAVKVIDRSLEGCGEIVTRFRQEEALGIRLRHPNLTVVYRAARAPGFLYLVMEFVEGDSLDGFVEGHGPLPVAASCEIIRQAAEGLQHLHKKGLVHRDVKPSNLMLTLAGRVKVLDLGLARDLQRVDEGQRFTLPGQFLGTPDYMAPEQCVDSHAVDGRTDVYGLGCTLYELLAGQPPFAGPDYGSAFRKMQGHVEAPVPHIRERRPDVPEGLAIALERMLAKDREKRFASPADVVAAMQPFAARAELARLAGALPRGAIPAA